MINKKIIGVYTLMLLIMLGMVSAATVTFLTPATSGTVTGSEYVLNVTITGICGSDENCNITYYAISSSTANSTLVQIAQLLNHNTTADDGNTNLSSTVLEDATDYTFNVTVTNGTDHTSYYS